MNLENRTRFNTKQNDIKIYINSLKGNVKMYQL
jgi:hypothetical protein